jgi:Fe-S cluster assembly iron-binding protein IscA
MLAISPRASDAISRALAGASVPDGAGLRLTAGPQSDHGTAVEISFVTAPEAADQVIETGAAADVFVAPAAVELLDDQVLDADVGSDGAITFALYTQGFVNGRPGRPGESAD